jgi:competence protein ComEC
MLDNGVERDWPISREWARVSMSRDIPRHVATPGLVLIHSEGIRAEVLWPSDDAREEGGSRRRLNNASAVIKVLNKHWAVLFTGDLEEEGEAALSASGADLASDILKVPHHGSRGSLDLEFLTKVNPKFAVISAGKDNRYGHPAPETIEAYRSMGARLLRTDRDGTVVIESCGRDLKIRRTMETRLRTVSWNAGLFSSEIDNYRRLWGSGWEIITGVD